MENKHDDKHEHHILSDKASVTVLVSLLILTIITVGASRINFGALNFAIAMLIASVKALLVMLFFMGLKYDERENKLFFASSFLFFMVFVVLTAADIFTRPPDWRAKGSHLVEVVTASKFTKPWISSPALVEHGKNVYAAQCVVCHGPEGMGNGAAAGALNPKPRNFHEADGWKNGRKVSDIFGTLKVGLNSMPSFSTLSSDDRWAVSHYILSLGPKAPESTNDDLKKVGIVDPSKDDGGAGGDAVKKRIPVELAMERYIQGQ